MDIGDCFVNKAAPRLPSHLWIVVSDPSLDADNVLIVNATDISNHDDHSCILTAADHPWLKKDSCVAYQWAKNTSVASLQQAASLGSLMMQARVSEDVLQRIHLVAQLSDELKGSHRELLRKQSLID